MMCPCFSGLAYKDCCQKYHNKTLIPENALKLMRSRYSAYTLHLVDYIMETTHPDNLEKMDNLFLWRKSIFDFSNQISFDGLEIFEFIDGKERAQVTFLATLNRNGEDVSFKEKSVFFKVNGHWLYHSRQT